MRAGSWCLCWYVKSGEIFFNFFTKISFNDFKQKKAATSYDGLGLNYRVVFVEDACRGIIESEIEEQKNRLINHGAVVVTSDKVNLFSTFLLH